MSSLLPSRAEVVQASDRLALEAERLTGVERAAQNHRAGRMRAALWRMERRRADALEAMELFRNAELEAWKGACEAALDRVEIEAELAADPGILFRGAYRIAHVADAATCKTRAKRRLGMLSAYAPPGDVLARLIEVENGTGSAVAARAVEPAPRGQVIAPDVAKMPEPARLTHIERYGADDTARIVAFVTRPVRFSAGALAEDGKTGPRFYVDIDDSQHDLATDTEVGGLVTRVRVARRGSGTRLALDLTSPVYHRVFYLPEPFRLVIDVSRHPPRDSVAGRAGPRVVRRVVLDPGHGGLDPGAIGPNGLREKDVTLDVAHRAAPLLAHKLGISTLLTRDTDDYVALDERAARANAFNADLFVSIHCNASESSAARGVMTFVLDHSRDVLAAQVAARENAASSAAAIELARVFGRFSDTTTLEQSLHFAELLQRSAMAALSLDSNDVRDGGVKRAGFYVLAGARMPSVLFEGAFISHPLEAMRLNTGPHRQKLADAIVNAVRAYRDGY
jgi:N-acetylmuramoyl-L-alanine amidase